LACGKGGVAGVFPSWGEVAPLILRVSGALVKKFRNYWEAKALVENYKKQKEMGAQITQNPEWWYAVARGRNRQANVYPSCAEASVQVIGVSGSIVKQFKEFEEAIDFINRYQQVSPPQEYAAMTPSPALDSHPSEQRLAKETIYFRNQETAGFQP
jgi:viroplasmin and RNaseH domain-containing protein